MRNILLTGAIAAAFVATPAAASADPANATPFSVDIAHRDLDLTTSEGVSRLEDRVRTRVRQLCSNGSRDSASVRLERECRASALAAAAPQVHMAIASAHADKVRLAATAPVSPEA